MCRPVSRRRLFASGLDQPRTMRTAPNGDIFVAESAAGRIRVLRTADGMARSRIRLRVFRVRTEPAVRHRLLAARSVASVRLYRRDQPDRPLSHTRPGILQARGPAQVIVPSLPEGGHWTRDVVFSPDGSRMFVAVGSAGKLDAGPDRAAARQTADRGLLGRQRQTAPTCWSSPPKAAPRAPMPPDFATVQRRRSSPSPAPCGAR